MQSSKGYVGLGVLLLVLGVVFLLQNFGFLGSFENLIWLVLFGAAGLAFLFVFTANIHQNWWAVIPGFTLLGLALLVAFGEYLGAAGGGMFLGAIGLSFLVIYLVRREFWWAIIPAGTLITLAIIAALANHLPGLTSGGILFLGLGATFGLVYLMPGPERGKIWPLFPGGILGVMGLLFMLSLGGIINYVWPLILILGGSILVVRAVMRRS